MKIAVIYDSLSGNTKTLAEKIKNEINKEDLVYFGEPSKEEIKADLYFIGSWTNKGDCTDRIKAILEGQHQKKIAYFATAGFGDGAYFDRLFERVKTHIPQDNELLAYFYCQGKMPLTVKERYLDLIKANPEDQNLKVSLANFDKALTHPDQKDLEELGKWTREVLSRQRNEN